MWIHLKWRQSWEGVETNLHKYSAPCFQHLKKFDFTQLMLGAAKRLIVWSPWPPCLTQSVWSHWSIIRRIFVVHFSIVILVFHDFDGMGCLKFPVWYFHAHYLSEDWRVSISMQISELVALSYPLRHCQRSWSSAIHQSATEWHNSTLQFGICESCVCYLQTHKKLTALFIRSLSELAYEFECLPKSKHSNKAFVVRGCSYIT